MTHLLLGICLLTTSQTAPAVAPSAPAPTLSRLSSLSEQAYVYGYPMVDNYKVLYDFSLNPESTDYKGPMNQIHNTRNVATPADRSIVAPNVDTPYSYLWMDLRTEPLVITIPPFERNRYVSLQLIDLYTYIFGYVTPRTNGNQGGKFLIAGPDWKGTVPSTIKQVFRCETEFALGLFRTQLFNAKDLGRVHGIQNRYRVTPLSRYLNLPRPTPAPALQPIEPVDVRKDPFSPRFFSVLNWTLQYMPVLRDEALLRRQFETIGVRPSPTFTLPEGVSFLGDLKPGMEAGMKALTARSQSVRSSAELFGSRDFLGTDYLTRATAAMIGIYGNAAEEYLGVGYQRDANGNPFVGTKSYTITFAPGKLPPVDAFWSITVYDKDRLLYANEINRSVINSAMLPTLKTGPDGSITLILSHRRPANDRVSNWLPIPDGPFGLTFRTYQPQAAIRNGTWTAPPVVPSAP